MYSCNYVNQISKISLTTILLTLRVLPPKEFFFLDTRHAEERKFTKRQVTHKQHAAGKADEAGLMLDDVEANYNKGFAARKALLGTSSTVNCKIPNRYLFFETLEDKLLPNTKIELNIEKNFSFQDCPSTRRSKSCIWKTILI